MTIPSSLSIPSGFMALERSRKGNLCQKPSKLDAVCEEINIDHRLTKPNTPKTNGISCPDFSWVEREMGQLKKLQYWKIDTTNE